MNVGANPIQSAEMGASLHVLPSVSLPSSRLFEQSHMPRNKQDVTPAELAILQELWDRQQATVRELTETLYPEQTVSDFATVQKLVKRLEHKACVLRQEGSWPNVFVPVLTRAGLIARRLQQTANDLCDGDLPELLAQLVDSRELSDQERVRLRSLCQDRETVPAPTTV